MTKPKIKIFSFFAGSGFLDLGFELSGFEIVYVNELYSPFMEAYRYSRKLLKLSSPEYGYHQGEKGDVKQLVTGKTSRICFLYLFTGVPVIAASYTGALDVHVHMRCECQVHT